MVRQYRYQKTDAFTTGGSLGNPAACLYLKQGDILNESEMLAIAKQHKGFVSEMVYCMQDESGIKLTYFSSACEVDFCGHGTIACMYSLIKNTPALLAQEEIAIETNRKGALTVYNRIPGQDAVLITAPKPVYIGMQLEDRLAAEALGLDSSKLHGKYPLDIIDAGLRTLLVPAADLQTALSAFPDEKSLKQFCETHGIDIVLLFSRETVQAGFNAHTRVFAPRFGYLEDPATGSGNSAFGYYMLKHGLWDGSDCRIEQGAAGMVQNAVSLSCKDGKVLFGGSATVRIDGVYYLQPGNSMF